MIPTLIIGGHRFERALLLAPMEDVTSGPFRALCRRHGADVVYTEFVSAEGLVRESEKSTEKISLRDDERPVGIQIFGERPDAMAEAATIACEAGPDLIDVNIGCPVRKVVNKGAGAALLRDLDRTREIVRRIVRCVDVPVTAKARIGWDGSDIRILELARILEDEGVAALSVHARTRADGYDRAADWRWIERVKRTVSIPVIANGDVFGPEDAKRCFEETGADGVMIGRAAIGNPWIFARIKHYLTTGEMLPEPDLETRVETLIVHLDANVAEHGELRGVREMRRQHGAYLRGLPGIAELRRMLVRAETRNEVAFHLRAFVSLRRDTALAIG